MEALLLDVMRADSLEELARAIADGSGAALAAAAAAAATAPTGGSGRATARTLQQASAALEIREPTTGAGASATAGREEEDSDGERDDATRILYTATGATSRRRGDGARARRDSSHTARLAAAATVDAVARAPFHVSRVVGDGAVLHVGFGNRDAVHVGAVDVLERGVRCAVGRIAAAAAVGVVQQRVMAVLGEAEGRLVAAQAAAREAAAADRLAAAYAGWVDAGDDLLLTCLRAAESERAGGTPVEDMDTRPLHAWVARLGSHVLAAAESAGSSSPPPLRSLALHFVAALRGLRGGISRMVQRVAEEGKPIEALPASRHPDWDATDAATHAAATARLPGAHHGAAFDAAAAPRGLHAQATDAVVALPVYTAPPCAEHDRASLPPPLPTAVLVALGTRALTPGQAACLRAGCRQIERKLGALLALTHHREQQDRHHGSHTETVGGLRAQLAHADDVVASLAAQLADATASLALYGGGGDGGGGDGDGYDDGGGGGDGGGDEGFGSTVRGSGVGARAGAPMPAMSLLRPAAVVAAGAVTNLHPPFAPSPALRAPLATPATPATPAALTAASVRRSSASGMPVEVAFHTSIAVVDALRRAMAAVAADSSVAAAGAGAAQAASRAIEHQLHALAPCRVVATARPAASARTSDEAAESDAAAASPASGLGVLHVATEAGLVFDVYFEHPVPPPCRAALAHGLLLFGPLWEVLRARAHAADAAAAAQRAQGESASAAAAEAAAAEEARGAAAAAAAAADNHARAAAAAAAEGAALRAALDEARAAASALEPVVAATHAAARAASEQVVASGAAQARLHEAMQLVAELAQHVDDGGDSLWLNIDLLRRMLGMTSCAALAVAHMPDPATGAMALLAAVTAGGAAAAADGTATLEATLAAAAGRTAPLSRGSGGGGGGGGGRHTLHAGAHLPCEEAYLRQVVREAAESGPASGTAGGMWSLVRPALALAGSVAHAGDDTGGGSATVLAASGRLRDTGGSGVPFGAAPPLVAPAVLVCRLADGGSGREGDGSSATAGATATPLPGCGGGTFFVALGRGAAAIDTVDLAILAGFVSVLSTLSRTAGVAATALRATAAAADAQQRLAAVTAAAADAASAAEGAAAEHEDATAALREETRTLAHAAEAGSQREDALREAVAALEAECAAERAARASLAAQLATAAATVASATYAADAATGELGVVRDRVERAEAAHRATAARLEAAAAECAALARAAADAGDAEARAVAAEGDAAAAAAALRAQLAVMGEERAAAGYASHRMEDTVRDLKASLSGADAVLLASRQAFDALTGEVASLKSDIATRGRAAAALADELAAARAENATAQTALRSRDADTDAMRRALNELHADYLSLSHTHSSLRDELSRTAVLAASTVASSPYA